MRDLNAIQLRLQLKCMLIYFPFDWSSGQNALLQFTLASQCMTKFTLHLRKHYRACRFGTSISTAGLLGYSMYKARHGTAPSAHLQCMTAALQLSRLRYPFSSRLMQISSHKPISSTKETFARLLDPWRLGRSLTSCSFRAGQNKVTPDCKSQGGEIYKDVIYSHDRT